MLLQVDKVVKAYGDNQVLNGVSLTLDAGQKLGLVGANGVGKSTLLRIVVGEELPDSGTVAMPDRGEVGYLPQALQDADELSVDALFDRALGDLRTLEQQLRWLEDAMASVAADLPELLARYSLLAERFELRGGYELAFRREQVFAGLELDHIAATRRVGSLSGGEKSRIGLAAILLRAPDLLILDEPTNHLDFRALEWLEGYLHGFRGGLLAVSHDRQFLNATVSAILEIDEQTRSGRLYAGAYDAFSAQKQRQRQAWEEEYVAQQEEIKLLRRYIKGKARQVAHGRAPRDNEKFAYTHKGERVQEAVSRNLHAAEEKLRRIEEAPIPRPPQPLRINPDFDPQTLVNKSPLEAEGLMKAYGARCLLDDVNLALGDQSRVVIVGPNGAGKSTLLRILAGMEPPDAGVVSRAASVVIGYLDQEQATLTTTDTVFASYRAGRTGDWEELKAELLSYHLFTYPELSKPVGTLSVGQKRKLQIALLIAQRANVLLLDEPTNHISLDVLEEFERALLDFPGPVIAVSHDRHFIRRFSGEIWTLNEGRLTRFLGSWEEWRAQEGFTR